MRGEAVTVSEYINKVPEERKEPFIRLREAIVNNLPTGFEETINYGMIAYVVPHSLYPAGYHCNPALPLPFINLASQKNYLALYHMGIYSDKALLAWFSSQYAVLCRTKLDMGKSCIRFKKMDDIPYTLVGKLAAKISVTDWIAFYRSAVKRTL